MAEIIWAQWGYDLMNLCRYIYNGQQVYTYDSASSLEDEWGYAVDTVANADVGETAFQLLDKLVLGSNGSLVVKPMMLDTGNGFKAGITFGDVSRVGNVYEVAVKGLFTQAPFIDVFGALTNAAGYDVEANKLAQLGADVLSNLLNKEVTPEETAEYKVNMYAEKNPDAPAGDDNEIITHIDETVAQSILNSMASLNMFEGTEIVEPIGDNIHAVNVDTPAIPNITMLWNTVNTWGIEALNHLSAQETDRAGFLWEYAANYIRQNIIPTIETPDNGIVVMKWSGGNIFRSDPYFKFEIGYVPSYAALDQYRSVADNIYFCIKQDTYTPDPGTASAFDLIQSYTIWRKNNGAWSDPTNPTYQANPAGVVAQAQYTMKYAANVGASGFYFTGSNARQWYARYNPSTDEKEIFEIDINNLPSGVNFSTNLAIPCGLKAIASRAGTGGFDIYVSNAFNEMSGSVDITVQDGAQPATKEQHDIDNWGYWLPRIYHGIDEQTGDATIVQHIPIDITNTKDVADTLSVPQEIAQAGVNAIPMGASYADSIAVPGSIDWLREMGLITVPSIADKDKAITIADEGAPTPTPTPIVPVLPPEITAQRLYTVHSVSQTEINNLGAYLWSTDFISLITNMFNAPIDAVIGLHTLYYGGSLPLGSNEVIKLGAVLAQSATVTCTGTRVNNQFMKFDCGSVAIPEYYGNVEDYAGYSKCEIFLPFIGFRELDINEIMGGSVYVRYGIDIFTGACVATIGVMRDGVSNALYAYEGNCAIQQPVTSADYSRLISGIISAGIAVAAGAASGGAGAAIGAASLLSGHKITYPRSGGLTANAGACLQKQPYIIIKRPKAYDASNYPAFYGNVTNWTVTLGQCHGYTRVKDVHIDQVACTDAEKDEILTLLKQGVIF